MPDAPTVRPLLDSPVPSPEAVVRVFEEAGIEFVFGMPGGEMGVIYDALANHRDRIRSVLVREEGLGAVMAEIYGRLTGRPGVVMGQAAWMLTNSGVGILEGFLAGSPMLVLADLTDSAPFSHHAPYQAGTGDYGTWDARNTIAGYTKQVFVAYDGVQAVQQTQLAIKHATSGTPGPVAVLYHSRSLAETVGPASTPRLYSTAPYLVQHRPGATAEAIGAAVDRIERASRPVVIAGNGVRVGHAQAELRAFAETLDLPVTTSASGKGVFPETHRLALGLYGTFGLEAANAVVADADLVIAVGTRLGSSDTANENPALLDPARQTFLQVDIDPRHASWGIPAAQALIGDAGAVLRQLTDAARDREVRPRESGRKRAEEAHRAHASWDTTESASTARPIAEPRVMRDLHLALPDDAIIACDAGENRLFMQHHFRVKDGMEYLQPAAVGGMGYAIPAALAAKLIYPGRTVVAVCGDGGFGVAMNGMLTAIEERIPIVVVVLNNGMLGWVYHGQSQPIASRLGGFDHAAIARAMGCEGFRVEDPEDLVRTVAAAVACGKPAVVDVITSPEFTFRDVLSPLAMPATSA